MPADGAEVRRITVTNTGDEVREIELTSYGEIVLAPPDADRVHPAFGNLFVETEWHDWCTAITATRRPRSAKEPTLWGVHVVDAGPDRVGPVTCETDRARFLGRGRSRPRSGRARPSRPAVGDDRRRAGPGVRHPRARAAGTAATRRRSRSPRWWLPPGSGPSSWRTGTKIPTPPSAPSTSRGPPRRWTCARWGSAPRTRECSRNWRGTSSTPTPRSEPRPGEQRGSRDRSRCSGRSASRATGRFCSRRSSRKMACRPCASCSWLTTTGGGAA